MTDKHPIRIIIEVLSESSITFKSDQSPKEIYDKMQLIFKDPDHFLDSPNLAGKIDPNYKFKLTHKFELGTLSIGGFAGMSAELVGQVLNDINGSTINATIKPNSYYSLLFTGMFFAGLFILVLKILSFGDDNSLPAVFLTLCIICPILSIRSYYVKKSLISTFVKALNLTVI